MSAKKKKQSNSPLRVIIILVLLGLLAYKHQLFDGKLLENIPTIESNEEKPEILTSPQHGGALEIPMIQSSTGGQILKRKGYTLSYNADYKTPQWVAWELTKKETKGKEGRTNKFLPRPGRTWSQSIYGRLYKIRIRPGTHGPCRRYEMEQTSHGRIFLYEQHLSAKSESEPRRLE